MNMKMMVAVVKTLMRMVVVVMTLMRMVCDGYDHDDDGGGVMTLMTMVVVVVTLTRMVVMIMIAIVLFNKVLNI